MLGQALYDTFGQTGAKLGMTWIGLLLLMGVFAPFIASSHPFVYRVKGGSLEFPLFRYLDAVDVVLLILAVYGLILISRRAGSALTLGLFAWPIGVIAWFASVWKLLPSIVLGRIYRPSFGADGFGQVVSWVLLIAFHLLLFVGVLALTWFLVTTTVVLYRSVVRQHRRYGLYGLAVASIVLSAIATIVVKPPDNVVYESYREAEKAQQVDLIVRTVIPYSPNDRLRDRPEEVLRPPSREHWLGTTGYGEDMLSRMLHACRVALAIGLIATSISTLIGIMVGGLMGYYAGRLDLIGMRFLEILEAVPTLILLLIVTVSFGRNLYLMMVVIGLLSWTADARFIRAEFFRLRNLDFVQAAIAAGLGRTSIIFRHMLPNGIAPVLVNASFGIAGAILLESTLSFLGLGLGPDDPSWGQLLEQARTGSTGFNWWIATFPGLAIFLTVFSYILIGESARDAIDPKLKKSQG